MGRTQARHLQGVNRWLQQTGVKGRPLWLPVVSRHAGYRDPPGGAVCLGALRTRITSPRAAYLKGCLCTLNMPLPTLLQ